MEIYAMAATAFETRRMPTTSSSYHLCTYQIAFCNVVIVIVQQSGSANMLVQLPLDVPFATFVDGTLRCEVDIGELDYDLDTACSHRETISKRLRDAIRILNDRQYVRWRHQGWEFGDISCPTPKPEKHLKFGWRY